MGDGKSARENRPVLAAALALIAATMALLSVAQPAAASGPVPLGDGVFLKSAAERGGPRTAPSSAARGPEAPSPMIIGGNDASILDHPWQVALEHSTNVASGDAFDRQICGGTLVAPTLVVTAAHCVATENGTFESPSKFSVVSGRTDLSSAGNSEVPVAAVHYFTDGQGRPLYDPDRITWDVALLRLGTVANGIPIKIAGPGEEATWTPGRSAVISGWGSTIDRGKGYPDTLQSAEVTMLPNSFCSPLRLGETSVCAGTATGARATCDGDSGGPLTVPLADGSRRLVGDTSFGLTECASYTAGAFGRVAADPMRSALAAAAMAEAGQDIIGSGGTPPLTMTPNQARDNAFMFVSADCSRRGACRSYWADRCSASGSGYRCRVFETRRKRRRVNCRRTVAVSAASGALAREGLGRWKCRRR